MNSQPRPCSPAAIAAARRGYRFLAEDREVAELDLRFAGAHLRGDQFGQHLDREVPADRALKIAELNKGHLRARIAEGQAVLRDALTSLRSTSATSSS